MGTVLQLKQTESRAAKLAEQQNGGIAPKAAPASKGKASSSTNDLVRLRMYVSERMPVSQIAQRLGKSVSAVMQEAAVGRDKPQRRFNRQFIYRNNREPRRW